jgi:hypothetical protein
VIGDRGLSVNEIRTNDRASHTAMDPLDFSTAGWVGKNVRYWIGALAFIATWLIAAPRTAYAESVIKHPGDHPHYFFEAEPHVLVGFAGPFKDKDKGHVGAGFRGTIVIVQNGFIKTINNSVGISFGADVFFGAETLFIPVAMQWNFWLATHWSVFGEPGVGFALRQFEAKSDVFHPILMAGGRYHFNENIALTLRIGYPAVSMGASFFF